MGCDLPKFRWKISQSDNNIDRSLYGFIELILNNRCLSADQLDRFLKISTDNFDSRFENDRIERALDTFKNMLISEEPIGIFGDYDADGVTSVAILCKFLSHLNKKFVFKLPTRDDGYGVNIDVLNYFKEQNINNIIVLDSGSNSRDVWLAGEKMGLNLLYLDHHEILCDLDDSINLVNPHIWDGDPLCSAGVILRFLMLSDIFEDCYEIYPTLLELAAIGTVGDSIELLGDSRIIVKLGLEQLKNTTLPGIANFLNKRMPFITIEDLMFYLVPLINSAGRVGKPDLALNFLLEMENNRSIEQCNLLESYNNKRKSLQSQFFSICINHLNENLYSPHVHFMRIDNCPKGIIGPLASRLACSYKRPFFLCSGEQLLYGSGRSPGNDVDLIGIFDQVKSEYPEIIEQFINFGGHQGAVGFTIRKDAFPEIKKSFERFRVKESIPFLNVDISFNGFAIDDNFFRALRLMTPFGFGNPKVVVCTKDVEFRNLEVQKDYSETVLYKHYNNIRWIVRNNKQILKELLSGRFDVVWEAKVKNDGIDFEFLDAKMVFLNCL
ncbi:DHH family phosphoesterase [Thermodesulfobium sp. 4217-1]|uniref:DHH family phosphoesterase n=1 Tax=Thermodesulfobium sp. 4217-1 TaxID=3120013 RepID=UPI0032218363